MCTLSHSTSARHHLLVVALFATIYSSLSVHFAPSPLLLVAFLIMFWSSLGFHCALLLLNDFLLVFIVFLLVSYRSCDCVVCGTLHQAIGCDLLGPSCRSPEYCFCSPATCQASRRSCNLLSAQTPILLTLERVIEGGTTNNLTSIILNDI